MYEVELKVPADHEAVRERLQALGATHRGAVRQVDTYFDAPHRNFAKTDEAFRLRRESGERGETTALTYKGPLVEDASKTRAEHETAVADGDAVRAIVEALGFTVAATVAKDRDVYALDGYAVTLDAVDDLGEFVEVETTVEHTDGRGDVATGETDDPTDDRADTGTQPGPDVERAREGAVGVLRRLDLDPDDQIRDSYLSLLAGDAD